MSEGEGDGDLEGLAGRVTKLTELLEGKEAIVEALNAEFDHLRTNVSSPTSSHSQNSNIPYKDIIGAYRTKVRLPITIFDSVFTHQLNTNYIVHTS